MLYVCFQKLYKKCQAGNDKDAVEVKGFNNEACKVVLESAITPPE